MQLTFLGSAAAEAWPALFCQCPACLAARRLGGKNLRRRTSYRLGEHIQIDWGPDTAAACLQLGLPTETLTDLVVTHAHEDHWTPHELFYRRRGFSAIPPGSRLTVHGPRGVGDALRADLGEDLEPMGLAFNELQPYQAQPLADGARVTALPAHHAQDIGGAFLYLFEVGAQTLFLAHDSGWWMEEVWTHLATRCLDMVIFDATYVRRACRSGHLGCPDLLEARDRLAAQGSLAPGCRCIANHFSHNGQWLHDEIKAFLQPAGVLTGYDGLVLDLGAALHAGGRS